MDDDKRDGGTYSRCIKISVLLVLFRWWWLVVVEEVVCGKKNIQKAKVQSVLLPTKHTAAKLPRRSPLSKSGILTWLCGWRLRLDPQFTCLAGWLLLEVRTIMISWL
jgi:hypothetical protein